MRNVAARPKVSPMAMYKHFPTKDELLAASLEDYLGDMRFYLDVFLGRFPNGIEFMGAPHRWVLDANWKLPVENQLGDVNHGAFLHSAIIPREAQDRIEELGHSVVTTPGHGATFRLMPA